MSRLIAFCIRTLSNPGLRRYGKSPFSLVRNRDVYAGTPRCRIGVLSRLLESVDQDTGIRVLGTLAGLQCHLEEIVAALKCGLRWLLVWSNRPCLP
jgi:hypothetical protein